MDGIAPAPARRLAADLLQVARIVVVEKVPAAAGDADVQALLAEQLEQRLRERPGA
ncbi:MAG TPA: hypothetical protein VGK92_03540 [Gaiellales bacterium]|jgi:hypothetical protein